MDFVEWDFSEYFTVSEAACLVLGIDPQGPRGAYPKDAAVVRSRMIDSYRTARSMLRQATLGGDELPPDFLLTDKYLQSRDMQALAWRAHQYDEETPLIDWLSNEGEDELWQQFSHDTLARWLTANDLPSKYEFRAQKIRIIPFPPVKPEQQLSTKERNVLLCIVAALAHEARIDIKKPSKAATLIRDIAHEKLGVAIGETTIEAHLKKIPDALETRAK